MGLAHRSSVGRARDFSSRGHGFDPRSLLIGSSGVRPRDRLTVDDGRQESNTKFDPNGFVFLTEESTNFESPEAQYS